MIELINKLIPTSHYIWIYEGHFISGIVSGFMNMYVSKPSHNIVIKNLNGR